jgi:hypothetical protein
MDRTSLPDIPLIDIGRHGPAALVDAARPTAEALLAIAQRRYGRVALRCGDAVSRAWLRRTDNPYAREIEHLAGRLGTPGCIMLNMSFEWGCSGLVEPDAGGGVRLLRVLDWRLDGLGRYVVVARADSDAGAYYNVTWPGAVGVLTAMAPGRFSAAIHQAPMRRHGFTLVGDWARNRALVWGRKALTPAHLLRQVFETAPDYAAARRQLAETKLALPVIFLLAGAKPDEACVIERLEDHTVVHDGPSAVANSWRADAPFAPHRWTSRGRENAERLAYMGGLHGRPLRSFDWVAPPVLNRDTRVAVRANAAMAELAVQGYESWRPATREFTLPAKGLAAA